MEKSKDYVSYDYKEVIADSNKISMLMDSYANFGWEIDKNITSHVYSQLPGGVNAYHKKDIIRLKRNRKIINKMELTRLQRNFEAVMDEINRLEGRQNGLAMVYALSIGILGTAFMAGSVFAVTTQPPHIFLCIILAIPAFIGWGLPYFVYKRIAAKQEAKVLPLIEAKYDEIHELCEKGNKLLH